MQGFSRCDHWSAARLCRKLPQEQLEINILSTWRLERLEILEGWSAVEQSSQNANMMLGWTVTHAWDEAASNQLLHLNLFSHSVQSDRLGKVADTAGRLQGAGRGLSGGFREGGRSTVRPYRFGPDVTDGSLPRQTRIRQQAPSDQTQWPYRRDGRNPTPLIFWTLLWSSECSRLIGPIHTPELRPTPLCLHFTLPQSMENQITATFTKTVLPLPRWTFFWLIRPYFLGTLLFYSN